MEMQRKFSNWMEISSVSKLELLENLPKSLYVWKEKVWSNTLISLPDELCKQLERIVQQYLRVMWLDETLYPARVDLGISWSWQLIIYEITTWFVDQVGSLLALQEMIWEDTLAEIIQNTPFDASFLSSQAYKPEYELMRQYFSQYWNPLKDSTSGEKVFLYGYPTEEMRGKNNLYPSWKWLDAEQKDVQVRILEIISRGTDFIVPRFFDNNTTWYQDLPEERCTKMIFKQSTPKLKWDQKSILFWKGKLARERYKSWEMMAQEYIPPFRDAKGRRFEIKALFMPNPTGTKLLGLYNLTDEERSTDNFGSTKIPNDGYPQWPVIITK